MEKKGIHKENAEDKNEKELSVIGQRKRGESESGMREQIEEFVGERKRKNEGGGYGREKDKVRALSSKRAG